jgi:hypothetical protein
MGKLRINSFIRLRTMFTEDRSPRLEIDDLGDSEKVLRDRYHFQKIRHGIVPIADGSRDIRPS